MSYDIRRLSDCAWNRRTITRQSSAHAALQSSLQKERGATSPPLVTSLTNGGGSALRYSVPQWAQTFQKSGLASSTSVSHSDLPTAGNAHLVAVIDKLDSDVLVLSHNFAEGVRVDDPGQWWQRQR